MSQTKIKKPRYKNLYLQICKYNIETGNLEVSKELYKTSVEQRIEAIKKRGAKPRAFRLTV
jgi:hypothetical protein